jgi:hypothetical protein
MTKIEDGGPGDIPEVVEIVPADAFENVIRRYGVVNACEWFGHAPDSEFTAQAILWLKERAPTEEQA